MPQKVLPTVAGMDHLAEELAFRKFLPVQGLEHFRNTTKDERAIPATPREGAELGYVFQKNDLAVVVWTTWLLARGAARENDSGWIVIEENGEGEYYIKVHRTKGFIENLLMEARIACWRLRHRPSCSTCGVPMSIAYGKGLGARYWRCNVCRSRESWDTKKFWETLPEDARRYLKRRRRRRELWYRVCRKNGKPIRSAMLRRRAWKRINLPVSGF